MPLVSTGSCITWWSDSPSIKLSASLIPLSTNAMERMSEADEVPGNWGNIWSKKGWWGSTKNHFLLRHLVVIEHCYVRYLLRARKFPHLKEIVPSLSERTSTDVKRENDWLIGVVHVSEAPWIRRPGQRRSSLSGREYRRIEERLRLYRAYLRSQELAAHRLMIRLTKQKSIWALALTSVH